jgi:hypothetical protein
MPLIFFLLISACVCVLCVFHFMNKWLSTSVFLGSKFECLSYACRSGVSIIRVSLGGGPVCHCSQSIRILRWVVRGDIRVS